MKEKWFTDQISGRPSGSFTDERQERSKKRLAEIAQGIEYSPTFEDVLVIDSSSKTHNKLRGKI